MCEDCENNEGRVREIVGRLYPHVTNVESSLLINGIETYIDATPEGLSIVQTRKETLLSPDGMNETKQVDARIFIPNHELLDIATVISLAALNQGGLE